MIDWFNIIKIVAPIVGSILLDDNIGPIKQENPYRSIVKNTIDTVTKVANECSSVNTQDKNSNIPITYHPTIDNDDMVSPFEIAINKEYKYTFK